MACAVRFAGTCAVAMREVIRSQAVTRQNRMLHVRDVASIDPCLGEIGLQVFDVDVGAVGEIVHQMPNSFMSPSTLAPLRHVST